MASEDLQGCPNGEHSEDFMRAQCEALIVAACTGLAVASNLSSPLLTTSYSTNFSSFDSNWDLAAGCFDCSAANPDECTMNFASAIEAASVIDDTGVTITTTRKDDDDWDWCDPTAGGSSGYMTFLPYLKFGTIRVKSKYFPGTGDEIATAKGFVGLESSSSGAITITIHGAGADPSGAPKNADWTRYMQSSCYQHGHDHNKEFTNLASAVDSLAESFNWFQIEWTSTSVEISVNGQVVRSVTDADQVPQGSMQVHLHSRSIAYSDMPSGSTFQSFIEEFHYDPL